jgi:predicted ATP-grasp superfamily ATP-dependent carboligase
VLEPEGLYWLEDEVPAASTPVLLVALDGFVDAGFAGRLAVDHLLTELDARHVATFDVDQLMDYRSRRPTMRFERDHWARYDEPVLAVYALTDPTGSEFLLLTGPEPDFQWERFAAAVGELVDHFSVSLTVGFNAIPMAVPHTRPTGVTAHATRSDLVRNEAGWIETAEVPGSAAAVLEFRLGEAGRDAMGIAVHVPHYLARVEYPQAALTLLEHVGRATGLALPTEALQEAVRQNRSEIEAQVADSEQVANVVSALERQYDAIGSTGGRSALLASDSEIPSGEDIAAEVEQFLAEQDATGDTGD